jgi:hypothetical protein
MLPLRCLLLRPFQPALQIVLAHAANRRGSLALPQAGIECRRAISEQRTINKSPSYGHSAQSFSECLDLGRLPSR